MNKIIKGLDACVKAGGYFAGFVCFILTGVVVFGVFTRYVLHAPSDWTMELSQYLFCAMTLLATAFALQEGSHVRIDLVRNSLPTSVQNILDLVQYPIVICLCIVLIWMGGEEFWSAFVEMKKSESVLNLPLWPVWSTIPLGGILLLLAAVSGLYKTILLLLKHHHKG